MKAITSLFVHLCLLRGTPAHIPTVPAFTLMVVIVNLAVNVLAALAIRGDGISTLTILASSVAGQATFALLVYGALALQNHTGRFAPTLAALFGCDAIVVAVLALLSPVLALFSEGVQLLAHLWILIWSVAIVGHILRHAMGIAMPLAIAIAVLFIMLSTAIAQMVM